jgi:hypothetical protein
VRAGDEGMVVDVWAAGVVVGGSLEAGTGGGAIEVRRVASNVCDEPEVGATTLAVAETGTGADAESFAFRAVFSAV